MTWTLPTEKTVPIVFAKTTSDGLAAIPHGAVVILQPTSDQGWNDFSYRVHMNAIVRTDDGTLYPYALKMMMLDEDSTSAALVARLGTDRRWMRLDEEPFPFISMLKNEDAYALMVRQLGFELAVAVLRATGDAVVLELEGGDPQRRALLKTEAFHVAVLRENEAWTAFRRGARHLRPLPATTTDDAAVSFLIAARLRSADAPHLVDIDFSPDPLARDRLAVLIGANGAGKTQIMLSILDGLRRSGSGKLLSAARRPPHLLHQAEPGLAWRAPVYNRVVVFSSTHSDVYPASLPPWEIDYQFFSMTGARERGGDALTVSLVDCLRDDRRVLFRPLPPATDDPDTVDFGDPVDRRRLLQALLEPMGLWNGLHLPLTPADDFDFPVDVWNDRPYAPISRRMNEKRNLQLVQHIDLVAEPVIVSGSEVRRLSSGETAMLRFAAQAVAAVEIGTLFLFDEPETHLHPTFISEFVEILHRLLKQTRSVAVIATHSVYLVRETPSQRVRIMVVEKGEVVVEPPRMQTFGASIEHISHAVFGDGRLRHQFQKTLAEWLAREGPETEIGAVLEAHASDLNPETLSYLARLLAKPRPTGEV